MATMNISLPDEMKAFVEERVASGRYANSSDFMRDLVRREMDDRDRVFAELRQLIQEGLDSGPSDRTVEQIRDDFLAKYDAKQRDDAA
jgi:antitoxin ParD1/3/4